MPETTGVRQEWTRFRSRGRLIAMAAATLLTILLGLLVAYANRASCSHGAVAVACPTDPVGPDGRTVGDQFYFVHRPMGDNGSITVRVTAMTGTITYPPPNHDQIVAGLVPWAKAGIIIKDGTARGSSYAALVVTGGHGVRMQYDYTHDIAGRPGSVSAQSPRWLRLTRAGATITGYESADGAQWTKVGSAQLPRLPRTVEVGLLATSPGDVTLHPTGFGGGIAESRFTQATGVFDSIGLDGGTTEKWTHGSVGEMGHTDWERYHRPPGLVESNGTFTVTGSGDIGPVGTEGGRSVEDTLVGLAIGTIVVIVVAVRFATAEYRSGRTDEYPSVQAGEYPSARTGEYPSARTGGYRSGRAGASPPDGRVLAAKAVVIGSVAFLSGLVAAAVVVPAGTKLLRANGNSVLAVSTPTELRVIVGAAALLAVAAVFALAVGALLRRTWVAILVALSAVVLPYVLAALPLLPDPVSQWLLRLTPAAGFAVQQTLHEYPQVVAHYAPSAGYFPMPWWAGFAVLCTYTAVMLALAVFRLRRQVVASPPQPKWR